MSSSFVLFSYAPFEGQCQQKQKELELENCHLKQAVPDVLIARLLGIYPALKTLGCQPPPGPARAGWSADPAGRRLWPEEGLHFSRLCEHRSLALPSSFCGAEVLTRRRLPRCPSPHSLPLPRSFQRWAPVLFRHLSYARLEYHTSCTFTVSLSLYSLWIQS